MNPTTPGPVSYLRTQQESVVTLAQELLEYSTQNPPGNTRQIINFLEAQFADLGLTTDQYAVDPAKPNLIATLPGEDDRVLCFNVDTVPFDADEWTYDPLGERDGDRLYGRGATDMKGALAAMLAAARAYVETETTPPITLSVAAVLSPATTLGAASNSAARRARTSSSGTSATGAMRSSASMAPGSTPGR